MDPQRRRLAAALALPTLWTGARAQAPVLLKATPRQTEGPFYPVELPADSDHDLRRNGTRDFTRGQAATVTGRVTDLQGKPLAGAVVEIWQCDDKGRYHHPGDGGRADPAFQGFGRVKAAADGSYRFETIKPVPYTGRTPHIHVKVRLGGRELLTTQLYVAGDPGNARDFLWRNLDAEGQAQLTREFRPAKGGLAADFPIVVAA